MMMRAAVAGFRKFPWIVLAAFALAGCATSDSAPPQGGDSSNPIRNLLMYGGTTVPEPMKEIKVEDEIECPAVEIREGGSTLRNGSAQAVSTQFSIRGLARECRADGSGDRLAARAQRSRAGDVEVYRVNKEGIWGEYESRREQCLVWAARPSRGE